MHRDASFHREIPSSREIKTFEDPEWQAEVFASFLLIQTKSIKHYEIEGAGYIENACAVSNAAANSRWRVFQKHNL